MYLNADSPGPRRKPCIRDLHELLRDYLPLPLVKLASLPELERRCHEIATEHPRFREEVPLVLQGETQRRGRVGARGARDVGASGRTVHRVVRYM